MSRIVYSIIIPHKNSTDLLIRCINSIPERDDVEIIIVDDNSEDDKVPTVAKERTVVVRVDKDQSRGAGKARNIGLSRARGEWILFADADDYYEEGFVGVLDKYKDCDADVVYFNHQLLREGKILKNQYPFIDRYDDNNASSLDEIKYRFNVPWNKMVRRSFLTVNGIAFEEVPVGNDIFYSYQIGYLAKKVIIEKSIVYNYIINNDSTIRRKKNSSFFYLTRFKHHYQCNEFFKFVCHPQWKRNIGGVFVAILVKRGWRQFFIAISVYINNYKEINDSKRLFVDEIKRRRHA